MQLLPEAAWWAIVAMGLVTYLTRALPFILKSKFLEGNNPSTRAVFSALGPALLAAIAVLAIMPDVQGAFSEGKEQVFSYLISLLATLLVLKLSQNAGFSLIIGVGIYACTLYVTGAA